MQNVIQAKTVSLGKSVKLDDLKDVKIGALQKGSQLVYDDVEEQFISLPPSLSENTYGTSTEIPQITIDSYGRISNIEQVTLVIGSTLGLIDDNENSFDMPLIKVLQFKGGLGVTTFVQKQSDDDFLARISIGQDVATTADVTFNKVTISSTPSSDTDAATKKYVDDRILSVDDISELSDNYGVIPTDIADLADTTNLLFDGNYNSLSNLPVIPQDISELSDNYDLLKPYSSGSGIIIDAYDGISHADTSTQSNEINSGRTYIQSIYLDDFGHITSIQSATDSSVNTFINEVNFNISSGELSLSLNDDSSTITTNLDGRYAQANQILNKTSDVNFNTVSLGDTEQIFVDKDPFIGRRKISQNNLFLSNIGDIFNSDFNAGTGISLSSIATSADGKYRLASISNNTTNAYISNDYGKNWSTKAISPAGQTWKSCAMSSDGKYQYILANLVDSISKSDDYGNTFTNGALGVSDVANFICTDSSGKYVLYGTSTSEPNPPEIIPKLYLSTDYGESYSIVYQLAEAGGFTHGKMSSDGKYITVTLFGSAGATIIRSDDRGQNWYPVPGVTSTGAWRGVAMSSNGQYQTLADCTNAGTNNGYIYVSNDWGVTYTQKAGNVGWSSPAMTACGQYQICSNSVGTGSNTNTIYISSDFGNNWAAVSDGLFINGVPETTKLEISSDGKYALAISGSFVYSAIAQENINGTLSSSNVLISETPTLGSHAITKDYFESALPSDVVGPFQLNNNRDLVGFSNSGFNWSDNNGLPDYTPISSLGTYGFFTVQNTGYDIMVSPFDMFGANVNYKIMCFNKYDNPFGDGLHLTITYIDAITGAEQSIPGFTAQTEQGSLGAVAFFEESNTLSTGTIRSIYYLRVYYAAYPDGPDPNGATIQDTTLYFKRV